MLKKILAVAIVATLFACSSSDDEGGKGQSSSSGDTSSGGSSSSNGMNFNVLYDFETESDNAIGYVFGKATLENDCVIDEDTEDCVLDGNGEPYLNWTPDGIFTLKNFSFNDGTQSNSGGGLILKKLKVKDYAFIKFDARSTAEGNHSFRIKAEKDGNGVAIRQSFELEGTQSFKTVTIEINKDNFTKDYNDAADALSDEGLAEYVLENATEVEFLIPIGRFSTEKPKHTLEIDNFAVAAK